jgi:hypothetical protein
VRLCNPGQQLVVTTVDVGLVPPNVMLTKELSDEQTGSKWSNHLVLKLDYNFIRSRADVLEAMCSTNRKREDVLKDMSCT